MPYRAEAAQPARDYARKTIESIPDATFVLATVNHMIDLDYAVAVANFEHARKLPYVSPSEIEFEIGTVLRSQGNLDAAMARYETAERLGAGTNRIGLLVSKAMTHLAAGRYPEAHQAIDPVIGAAEGIEWLHIIALIVEIEASFRMGNRESAARTLDIAWLAYGTKRPEFFPGVLVLLGRTDLAHFVLEGTEARFQEGKLPVASQSFCAHLYLGNTDEVFVWLRRAIDNREWWLFPFLHRSPVLDPIRDDPRFQEAMSYLEEIESRGTTIESVAYP